VLAAARRAAKTEVRIGVAPTRFAAHAAARRETIVPPPEAGDFLAGLPVSTLAGRLELPPREAGSLIATMRRLGIEALGDLAALSPGRIADRFGPAGSEALRLARGEEGPLRPRRPHEELAEQLELPEGAAGDQLEHALKLLVARLLAAPQRKGRTLLGLRLGAVLSGGGSWSVDQGLGRPTASERTLRAVLAPRLETLPGPVAALRLRALGLGPPVGDQLELPLRGEEHRKRRLGEAIREVRSAQGAGSLLTIVPLDSASRFPERWAMLTPSPDR
jgi:protein ImuB